MTTEARRDALYSRLQEVLGDEPAATLMTMLPGAEPADKTDIADVRAEITSSKTELKADIAEVRAELGELRDELKADISAARTELRADIAEVRAELLDIRTDIRQLQSNVQANVRTFVVTQTSTVIAVAGMVLAYDRLFG